MHLKPLVKEISHSNIVDQVASFLMATGHIPENAEVTNIDFGQRNVEGLVKITVYLKEEVEVVRHKG